MKKICLIIIFLLQGTRCFSQTSNSQVQQQIFSYLKDSCGNFIGFGCGYMGVNSRNLLCINELIYDCRKDLIQHLLYSKNISTQYLAVEALLMFEKETKWKMDSTSDSMIDLLRTSGNHISFCLGCARGFSYNVADLLNRKKGTPHKFVE